MSPNIALVVLDTLRKDAFDEFFDWLPGRRFERAYSTSHWTVPAHGTLFTGKYPSETNVHSKSVEFTPSTPILADELGDRGYSTYGYSANVNVSPLWGFDEGFDTFQTTLETGRFLSQEDFDWDTYIRTHEPGALRFLNSIKKVAKSDTSFLRSLRNGLELKFHDSPIINNLIYTPADTGASSFYNLISATNFDNPSFVFCNLTESHTPYKIPNTYRTGEPVQPTGLTDTLNESPDAEAARRSYNDTCRYLSDQYQQIFEELISKFDYVITLSDHGELFGEHGYWEHEWGVYPELTHVPLVISGTNVDTTTDGRLVSLTDVYQIILDLASGKRDFDIPNHEYIFAECHGLPDGPKSRMESGPYSSTAIEKYDQAYVASATESTYVYMTPGGIENVGNQNGVVEDVKERSRNISLGSGSGETDVPSSAKERLERLGYL